MGAEKKIILNKLRSRCAIWKEQSKEEEAERDFFFSFLAFVLASSCSVTAASQSCPTRLEEQRSRGARQ